LDRYVLPYEIQFFTECDFVSLVTRKRAAQQFAQMFDDTHGAGAIVVANKHGDGVECVEKKVWIELRLQCGEAGAGKLFGQSSYLHFALARVDEITRCMLDANHAEINCNTERQRDEDPTQPFNS